MSDLVAAVDALAAAELAKTELVEERRERRASMPRDEFRIYSNNTIQKQRDVEENLREALDSYQTAYAEIDEQAASLVVDVGPLSEKGQLH